jgi:glutamate N-acetyltransferase/amino-acid N-acetyltransferase
MRLNFIVSGSFSAKTFVRIYQAHLQNAANRGNLLTMGKKNIILTPSPKGFLFSAVEAGIKKPGRKDLALIYSEKEAVMAGVFTNNKIKAAPVKLDMQRIKSGKGRAIIANSGNANACCGSQGMKDAMEMTDRVARWLKVESREVYVSSTGVIGTPLPMGRIRRKIPQLVAELGKVTLHDAASAIMTTDTFPKVATRTIRVGEHRAVVTGICKGAGMVCPDMATMLCFIMTDLSIGRAALSAALKTAVGKSFNKITVDGDMSTNDTVFVMANGASGNKEVRKGSREFRVFEAALCDVAYDLSKMTAKDGEGATKLIEIEVRNAKTPRDADRAAFAVANSLLVKTAIYGNDANWGRIMAALGYSGVELKEENIDVFFGRIKIVRKGLSTGRDKEANLLLKEKEIKITIDLRAGIHSAKVLTCDLTEDYVRINAEYRT